MQSIEMSLAQLLGLHHQQSAEASAALLLAQVQEWIAAGVTGGGLIPTIFIAASDATPEDKAAAGPAYTCDGVADEVQINLAIAALPVYGGRIVFSGGHFYLANPITPGANTTFSGQGQDELGGDRR